MKATGDIGEDLSSLTVMNVVEVHDGRCEVAAIDVSAHRQDPHVYRWGRRAAISIDATPYFI